MGGPAMIEGGGLGVVAPDEVGPMSVQVPNGVVDLLVPDEAAAVAAARRYLSYFGGSTRRWRMPRTATSACCATCSRRTGCAATTSGRSSRPCATRAACSSCGPGSAPGC